MLKIEPVLSEKIILFSINNGEDIIFDFLNLFFPTLSFRKVFSVPERYILPILEIKWKSKFFLTMVLFFLMGCQKNPIMTYRLPKQTIEVAQLTMSKKLIWTIPNQWVKQSNSSFLSKEIVSM